MTSRGFYKNSVRTFSDLKDRSKLNPDTGCLEWQLSKTSDGYGRVRFKGQQTRAHRVAMVLLLGEIPAGRNVLHRCDNPSCINPTHLYIGTGHENMADRKARGRAPTQKGAANGYAKLTEALVREIRASKETQRAIADRLGISQASVSFIRSGKRWNHLT